MGDRGTIFKDLTKGLTFSFHNRKEVSKQVNTSDDSKQVNSPIRNFFNVEKALTRDSAEHNQTKRKKVSLSDDTEDIMKSATNYGELFGSKKQLNNFRNALGIKVRGQEGYNLPQPLTEFCRTQFSSLLRKSDIVQKTEEPKTVSLVGNILHNVEESQYKEPTPVQMQAIPAFLLGNNLVVSAPTGSGKTSAFVLPLLLKHAFESNSISFIVAPTLELATQIKLEAVKLSKNLSVQFRMLDEINRKKQLQYDIVISTPKKLLEFLKSHDAFLDGKAVGSFVVDEADKLFDLTFLQQIDDLISLLKRNIAKSPKPLQIALFSATIPEKVIALTKSTLTDPLFISVGGKNSAPDTIDQQLIFVGQENGKLMQIKNMLKEGKFEFPMLVFVDKKQTVDWLTRKLSKHVTTEMSQFSITETKETKSRFRVEALHSGIPVKERRDIMDSFRADEIFILVCSDLIGRGLDFPNIKCVLNYDCPRSNISYIHRIGRTGRANKKGTAVTLFTIDDFSALRSISNVIRQSGKSNVDVWMNRLKKQYFKDPRSKRKSKAKSRTSRQKRVKTSTQK